MSVLSERVQRVAAALGDRVERGVPLGTRTTYRVGGLAALFVAPADEAALVDLARALDGADIPVLVVGRGSNLLVADRGFDGLVVALDADFDELTVDGTAVTAGANVSLPVLARRTAAAGLTGLEWAVGVPGSVGGAVRMNAGGHGSDTAATLERYRVVDLRTAEVADHPAADLDPGYRTSSIRDTDVVVAATFRLAEGDPAAGAAEVSEIVRWRREHQPGGSNAGSVFTNPPDDAAGRVVEAAGLKGFRIGSAQVSEKHANFIQADEGGSADDVHRLIGYVQSVVAAATGTELRTEIRLVGFDDDPPGEGS